MNDMIKSTVQSRALGDAIRIAMDRASVPGKRLAQQLDWSETRVSRTLSGHNILSEVDLASILTICSVNGDKRERLLKLCQTTGTTQWDTDRNALVDQLDRVVSITEFKGSSIPTLLQLPSYTRSILNRSIGVTFDQIDPWVNSIQDSFTGLGHKMKTRCTFLIHEQGLRLPVESPRVMVDQLGHLINLSNRRYISIRIIPMTAGAYPGIGYEFCLLEFHNGLLPVIYNEDLSASHFSQDVKLVDTAKRVLVAQEILTKNEAESRIIMEQIRAGFDECVDDQEGIEGSEEAVPVWVARPAI